MDNLENIIPKNKNLLGLIISEYICNCVDDNSIVITNDENKKIVNDEESDGVTVWIEPPHNLDIVEEDSKTKVSKPELSEREKECRENNLEYPSA